MLIRNPNPDTRTGRRRSIVTAVVVGIALVAGLGTPAGADPKPAIQLDGIGTFQVVNDGTATVRGIATGRPVSGLYTGTLTANDGSLPDPGECELATAALRVDGAKRRFVELVAQGDLCGQWTDAVLRVTHVFTGRYDVTASVPQRLQGTDGFYEVRIADVGVSGVSAIDT